MSSYCASCRSRFCRCCCAELIGYDWKFPAGTPELDSQLALLRALKPADLRQWMAPFAQLQLSPELPALDWINLPAEFSEHLTTHLWATHQIDQFRSAATEYVQKLTAATPPSPLPLPRLSIVVLGQGVNRAPSPLFRKLRPEGTYFTKVKPDHGLEAIRTFVEERAAAHPVPFGHWYVDGAAAPASSPAMTSVSYSALEPLRTSLLNVIEAGMRSGAGPEALRTKLAETNAQDLGLVGVGDAAVLNQFQVSLLTEGSGTQIFSTTFVQWSAREILRRAQPLTLLARFTPRRRGQSLKETLEAKQKSPELDPEGSLVDAEMAAYYTWLNQQRLPGAAQSAFLVWFENHSEALVISPSHPRGQESTEPIDIPTLLHRLV